MGHPSDERLHVLKSKYPFVFADKTHMCDVCNRAKQRKLLFTLSTSHTTVIFDIIHVDIWGPCSTTSMQGFRYFFTIVDDFSRYTWIILLHAKSEVRTHLINFFAYVENQFKTTIKCIRSDNGAEFAMKTFFASKGTIHQTTCIETPQQNGIAERKHQHILNITCALLFQANLPHIFWDFVVQHVVFLINCTPTPLLQDIAPYEKLFGKPCDISSLRVFGCSCYSTTIHAIRKKLDTRSVHGIFLGFPHNNKGYIILNLKFHRIEVSRHVIFHEHHFPYILNHDDTRSPDTLSLPIPANYNTFCDDIFLDYNCHNHEHETPITHSEDNIIPQRRSSRQRRLPAYLEDFQTCLPDANIVSNQYPIHKFLSYTALSPSFKKIIFSISSNTEPSSYTEASKHSCWKQAMLE